MDEEEMSRRKLQTIQHLQASQWMEGIKKMIMGD